MLDADVDVAFALVGVAAPETKPPGALVVRPAAVEAATELLELGAITSVTVVV